MKLPQYVLVCSALGVLAFGGSANADTKVELKNVHLCCGNCVKAVGGILKDAGATDAKCDPKTKTVTFAAGDNAAAQKAVDALAAAGFHGDTGNKDVAVKEDSGVKKGKVKTLALTGAHNCCPNCCKALKATIKTVDGVTGDTAKPKDSSFTVTGDFDGEALVKALNAAGFHVKVKE
jgi:copper chaperone CopZ